MRCILVGYGYWGKIVERYIKDSESFELVGISDPCMPDSIDLEDIWEKNLVECAFVCTPIKSHFEIVQTLLKHNIHVFCEKPLCKRKEEMLNLIQLAEKRNLTLFTDYIYTVSPSLQFIKEHIYDLGKICYIDMSIKQFGRFYKEDNVFEVIGVHMISALACLLDAKENDIQVFSVDKIKSGSENLIEAGILFFKVHDINGKIECSLLSDSKQRKIEIVCERGIIVFDMLDKFTVKIILHSEDGEGKVQSFLAKETYDETNNLTFVIEKFYQSIMQKDRSNINITKQVAGVLDQISSILNP